MSCSRLVWQALSVVPIAVLLFPAHPAIAAKQSPHQAVYVLKQNSQVFGDHTVYISADAMRLDMQRLNCSVVTKLPGKKFQMFSPAKKLFYERDIDKWHANFSAPDKFEKKCKSANISWRAVGVKDICGIVCGEYILGRLKGSHDPATRHMPKDPNKRRYYLADSIPLSHEASELFAKMCKITPFDKMPLRVRVWDSKHDGFFYQLNTVSCEKKTVPSSFFCVPPKFKKTENEFDVFVAFGDAGDPITGIEDILFQSTTGKDKPSK